MRSAASPTRQLLDLISSPQRVGELSGGDWDLVIRTARSARLLGALAAILRREGALTNVPEGPRRHLESALVQADFRRQAVLRELRELESVLAPLSIPLVALKGSAYVLQGLDCAEGRLPADVDIMTLREHLPTVESLLVAQGWEAAELTPYDERYYREWSHQVPPLRKGGRELEVDLHHAIVAPTSRFAFNPALVLAQAQSIEGFRFVVLSPTDQVLHAAAHLFHEDCRNRLRDVVDLQLLFVEFSSVPGFWDDLVRRAALLRLERTLGYALAVLKEMLHWTPPAEVAATIASRGPSGAVRAVMLSLLHQVLPPDDVEGRVCWKRRVALRILLARSLWLRFPTPLLVRHLFAKSKRAIGLSG